MIATSLARQRLLGRGLVAALVLFSTGGTALPALAAEKIAQPVLSERVKRHRIQRPRIQRSSSDETTAERDRRLLRECRGRPNAGACLGFAS